MFNEPSNAPRTNPISAGFDCNYIWYGMGSPRPHVKYFKKYAAYRCARPTSSGRQASTLSGMHIT